MERTLRPASVLAAGALLLSLALAGPALAGPHHGGGASRGGGGNFGGGGWHGGGGGGWHGGGGGGWHGGGGGDWHGGGPGWRGRPGGPGPRWSGNWHGGGWNGGGWYGGRSYWGGPNIVIGGGFYYPYTYGYSYPYYGYSYPYYGYTYPPAYGYPPTYSYPPTSSYPPTYTPGSSSEYPPYPPPDYQGNEGYGDGDYSPPPDVRVPPSSSQSAPPEPDVEVPPTGEHGAASKEYGAASNYGFVQFRDVPNGAAVDLDRRPWVRSPGLENRWLAIPAGAHTITVRAAGYAPTDLRIDVTGGRQHIVRVGSLRAATYYRDDS